MANERGTISQRGRYIGVSGKYMGPEFTRFTTGGERSRWGRGRCGGADADFLRMNFNCEGFPEYPLCRTQD